MPLHVDNKSYCVHLQASYTSNSDKEMIRSSDRTSCRTIFHLMCIVRINELRSKPQRLKMIFSFIFMVTSMYFILKMTQQEAVISLIGQYKLNIGLV